MPQMDYQKSGDLQDKKMTNNPTIAAIDSTFLLENRFKLNSRNQSRKVNNAWFYSAVFGLAGGAATMLCGLIVSLTVWMSGHFLNESRMGIFSTALLVVSFALFFFGGFCLDKAYDSFYRRGADNKDRKGGANGVS